MGSVIFDATTVIVFEVLQIMLEHDYELNAMCVLTDPPTGLPPSLSISPSASVSLKTQY